MNPKFKQVLNNNIKDFIFFILNQFHIELKRKDKSNKINNLKLENINEEKAYNSFYNSFKDEFSIITEIFYGFIKKKEKCLTSNVKFNLPLYKFLTFNYLIFPLEKIKNKKIENLKKNNSEINQNNHISLDDCFSYCKETELLSGKTKNKCNICNNDDCFVAFISLIFRTPKVLIIILEINNDNVNDIKLDFTEKLNILEKQNEEDKKKISYELYGVITQIGQNGENYIASCKSYIDNKWYRYNDSEVQLVSNIKKEILEFETPLVLFYSKE